MFFHLKTRADLQNQSDVDKFFQEKSPEYVLRAAAKVGGIYAIILTGLISFLKTLQSKIMFLQL